MYEFQGTVTQKSNGTIVITPTQDSKRLPAMGDAVTISIDVTEPVAQHVDAAKAEDKIKKAAK